MEAFLLLPTMGTMSLIRSWVRLMIVAGAVGCSLVLALDMFDDGDVSSCMSAKTPEQCRSQVEEGTGDPCVWCSCQAIPSECVGPTMAKVGMRTSSSVRRWEDDDMLNLFSGIEYNYLFHLLNLSLLIACPLPLLLWST